MEDFNKKIELVGQEMEGQLSVMEKVVAGSEAQEIASKALERTGNTYAKLAETQAKIEHDKAELELQKQKLEQEAKEAKASTIQKWADTGLNVVKAICAIIMVGILAHVESVDYSNGEIASKPVQTQLNETKKVLTGWFTR